MKNALLSPVVVAFLAMLLCNVAPVHGATSAEPKAQKIPFHGKLESVDTAAQTIAVGKTGRVFHLTSATKITDGSGNPASLSAAVVGEDVGGSYVKDTSGTMTLFSVRFGAKEGSATAAPATAKGTPAPAVAAPAPVAAAPPTPTPAPTPAPAPTLAPVATKAATSAPADAGSKAKAKKSRFSGKVVSSDAASNTLVVHGKADQTFTVTSTTKITDASGSPATLAAAVAGTKVSGTYSKDGSTLTVYTLKIGK